jgi:hypothetical protein
MRQPSESASPIVSMPMRTDRVHSALTESRLGALHCIYSASEGDWLRDGRQKSRWLLNLLTLPYASDAFGALENLGRANARRFVLSKGDF